MVICEVIDPLSRDEEQTAIAAQLAHQRTPVRSPRLKAQALIPTSLSRRRVLIRWEALLCSGSALPTLASLGRSRTVSRHGVCASREAAYAAERLLLVDRGDIRS